MTALIARICGVLGAFAAVGALATWVLAPELPGLRTLSLMGAVGLGSWLYLDWPTVRRFLASRGGMEAGRAALIVLLAAGIAVAGVALVDRTTTRRDFTPQQVHSVTERTAQALAGVDADISIVGFFSAGGDRIAARKRARWDALAAAFEAASPRVAIETLDPDVARQRATAEGVTSNGVAVVRVGEARETVWAPDEQTLLNGVLRAAGGVERRVYVSTGHGERPVDEITAESLTDLGRMATELGLAVAPLDLARRDVPDDATVVLVIDPATPLGGEAADRLERWLSEGGSLLVAAEPGRDTGLEALLARGGLGRRAGLVADPLVRSVTGDAFSPLVARWGTHEAVRGLRAPAALFGASPLVETEHRPTDATVHVLAWSSGDAWAETSDEPARDPGEATGPLALLALADLHPGGVDGGVVALAGDADWLANEGIRQEANADLALRLLGALTSRQDLVTLAPRPPVEGALSVDWVDHLVLSLLALLGLPGGCVAVAGVLAVRRAGR